MIKNNKFKKMFPMLENIVYLDSAALAQKPLSVIEAGVEFYSKFSISTRTSDSKIGILVQQKVDLVREKIAKLIDAKSDEIIFSSGTTESINFFSLMAKQFLKEDDEILLSYYNHSSNIVPWMQIAKELKLKIVFSKNILKDINEKTKLICYSQVTNNLNQNFNSDEIYKKAKENNAIVLNDAAQAIAHEKVTFKNSDVVVFSANKMYGPTGLGVLAIKNKILKNINPVFFGGGAVEKIESSNDWVSKKGVSAFEPGTPNLAAIWQFEKSIDLINEIKIENIHELNLELSKYLYDQLLTIKDIKIASKRGDFITLFNIKNYASQDIASYLGHKDIYVRSGNFCSKLIPLVEDENDYVRVSLAFYNDKSDIDKLIQALKEGGDFLSFL
ncbi:aminotransferase class V-fold PLP-dependent enzyme [Mesomycoplasma molare]|uniref:Aminotransferase class V-fold PLP-dependent enzyme n=1 Tax=Mesomycoplasma molare TaxID=171288 RepID=A0ABY5TV60_9BACT|nr:aminotransferase class V-fold PLP-dependent enzyme [Mesomycoplasma molare]UWD33901.1 aminotransferase class V-fold PLP-dependent enzyme [Mesomycoplasma molare]